MILSGQTIKALNIVRPHYARTTWVDGNKQPFTYGCGPAGYDVRIEFDKDGAQSHTILRPGDFYLASTIEQFFMPDDVLGVVHDKSSWARRGLCVQNTVLEPGWTGYLTLELTNHSQRRFIIERGCPIAQVVFHRLDIPTNQPYNGKYQGQTRGPQKAR